MDDQGSSDTLAKKHRQEQRDLQARITQKKKNASKKTRKGVNDECATLELELKERHAVERAAANGEPSPVDLDDAPENEASDAEEGSRDAPRARQPEEVVQALAQAIHDTSISGQPQAKKPNRQKARLARRAADQEEAAAQAAEEAANLPDRRAEERAVMAKEMQARGLVEREVRSDGHCLYAAMADQMKQSNIEIKSGGLADYQAVRRDAATFIEAHAEDFAAFLEEPLDVYVAKVRDTAEWGGQLELSALARAYGLVIKVLQGDGRVETIETRDGKPAKEIWLAYYRHSFGLGEHYNSLRKKP